MSRAVRQLFPCDIVTCVSPSYDPLRMTDWYHESHWLVPQGSTASDNSHLEVSIHRTVPEGIDLLKHVQEMTKNTICWTRRKMGNWNSKVDTLGTRLASSCAVSSWILNMLSAAQGHLRTFLYGLFRTNYKNLKLRWLLSSSVLTWWDWKVCNRAKYLNLKLKREKCIAETRSSETQRLKEERSIPE